jgi:hypothetical protein
MTPQEFLDACKVIKMEPDGPKLRVSITIPQSLPDYSVLAGLTIGIPKLKRPRTEVSLVVESASLNGDSITLVLS